MASRRSNKSHRVPNVKLRPAQPSTSSRRVPSPPPRTSSPIYGNEPECSFYDPCPRPFKGVVLCATGVDKSLIFGKASELGATTTLDFTDRVTHLIADAHGGAKYNCALSRQIPIMKPEWILDSFDIWQRGDDVDLQESVAEHRLPIFSDVVLCLSGIEDMERRTEINRIVTAQQGSYVKVIERPVRVTHLLCSGDGESETDKMRYARKFNERGEAKIWLVWEEWFWDSLEFGGRFAEEAYKVDQPRPERKQPPAQKQPANVPDSEPTSAQPDVPASSLPPNPNGNAANQDPDEEETARITRVPAVTLRIWENLLGPRGYTRVGERLVRNSPSASPSPEKNTGGGKGKEKERQQLPEPEPEVENTSRRGRSALSTFTRTNSFAPARPENAASAVRQPFRRQPSSGLALGAGSQSRASVEPVPAKADGGSDDSGASNLFSGLRFRARGEARCKVVRFAVENGGGTWIEGGDDDEDEKDEDYVIVRLVSGSKLCRAEPSVTRQAKYRTECWLEACLARRRICEADEHLAFRPLAHDGVAVRSSNAEVVLSPSGLDMAEDTWLRRLTRALGITHAPVFSRATTHLLCPSATGAKFEKALEWRTPIIGMGWLEEMAKSGEMPDVRPHLVVPGQLGDAKGKGKAKPTACDEAAIIDITNAADPPPPVSQPKAAPAVVSMPQPSPKRSLESIIGAAAPQEKPADPWGQPNLLLNPSRSRSGTQPAPTPPPAVQSPTKSASRSRAPSAQNSIVLQPPAPSLNGRVPSSTSPSPLKAPAGSSPASAVAPSPIVRPSPLKPAVSSEDAVALQESITSLLGKRNSGDGADDGRSNSRKRPRQRSKPQSRHMSGDSADSAALPIVQDDPAAYEGGLGPYSYSYTTEDNSILAAMRAEGQDSDDDERRMVTYEDPIQAQEKKRLLSLLGGRDGGKGKRKEREVDGEGAQGLVRRSTRVAGF
ncbi:hypothetical protein DENSPDRAFT_832209 [Dentipellis sp. KUC8613]|nr:hypothetical protein DENSPDRAFT_832209 [Dentipellis sp. KUC8613]